MSQRKTKAKKLKAKAQKAKKAKAQKLKAITALVDRLLEDCLVRECDIEDCVIREVRINDQSTPEAPFKICQPEEVARFVRGVMSDNSRAHAIALYLDGAHQVIAYVTLSIGDARFAPVHRREVFQRAVAVGAVAFVMAHHHPSGQLEPREEDRTSTRQLSQTGKMMGIPLLDHVIVTHSGHSSFKEKGLLEF